jgi:hypothetical protein
MRPDHQQIFTTNPDFNPPENSKGGILSVQFHQMIFIYQASMVAEYDRIQTAGDGS